MLVRSSQEDDKNCSRSRVRYTVGSLIGPLKNRELRVLKRRAYAARGKDLRQSSAGLLLPSVNVSDRTDPALRVCACVVELGAIAMACVQRARLHFQCRLRAYACIDRLLWRSFGREPGSTRQAVCRDWIEMRY